MGTIAVTARTPDLDQEVEPRFGRAPYVLLVDPDTLSWEALENPGLHASGGAGIQVAQLLSERGVGAVVSGEFGPKAHDALAAAGIAMHRCGPEVTARRAVELLQAGELGGKDPMPGSPSRSGEGEAESRPGGGRGWGRGSGGGGRGGGRMGKEESREP